MKILLDSHILFWAMDQEEKIPADVLDEINNPANDVFYSVLSVWELTLKNLKNPKGMPVSGIKVAEYCDKSGFTRLPLQNEHVQQLATLNKDEGVDHKDPFDRMLICQAKAEGMIFITHDTKLSAYHESCVNII